MNENVFIVGKLQPLSDHQLQQINQSVKFSLPDGYKSFLGQLGFGSINELLMIEEPDPGFIQNNFLDYMDFWNWEVVEETRALNGLTIARTIDGDIIEIIDDRLSPFLILPRHSDLPVKFPDFSSVIGYYDQRYDFEGNLYFDPYVEWQQENINIGKVMVENLKIIQQIHEDFLANYQPDSVFNANTQPKYMMREIGGWVYFDKLSGSSIRIKYQTSFKYQATALFDFINRLLEQAQANILDK
ncbi:hypothetical protein ACLOAU_09280 [Niabella sp. CJ426]|uniref:hypothetical protein n=1 Tax=Niabella sp. CJ426 TaxID=3393740 RepID=UPI003D04B4D9